MRKHKREFIARRAAREIEDGFCVNLGLGIPALVAKFLPEGVRCGSILGKRCPRLRRAASETQG